MPQPTSHPWGRPGDLLRHPVAIIALALWLLNDHLLKSVFGNELTGKLSDGAGLIVFPLVLLSLVAALVPGLALEERSRKRLLGLVISMTGGILVMLNLSEWTASWVYELVTLLQWPFVAGIAVIQGEGLPEWNRVSGTVDPTDLWTLPCLGIPIALVLGRERSGLDETKRRTE